MKDLGTLPETKSKFAPENRLFLDAPKGNEFSIPTIHFQVRLGLVSERVMFSLDKLFFWLRLDEGLKLYKSTYFPTKIHDTGWVLPISRCFTLDSK